ncbi:MAG TPA: CHASE2 domain-containing protein [Candidatus Angelobacter sp.]|jgi:CHASE2 domain-containing sensor protein
MRKILFGRRLWLWVVYIAIVLAVIAIDYAGEVYETNCGNLTWTTKLWHQRLCLAGHRKPRAHYVRVVTITAGNEYDADAHCAARKFVGTLLLRLRELGPALIVIDKFYKPSLCNDATVTAGLQDAVNQVSSTIPVVLGRSSDRYEDFPINSPDQKLWQALKLGQGNDVEVLSESSISTNGTSSQLGLVRLSCNTWEIPVRLQLYPTLNSLKALSEKERKKNIEMDTLSFAAAKKFDIDLAKLMRPHVEHHDSLVGAFLPIDRFHPLTASQVLCGLQATKYDAVSCQSGPSEDLALRGKIVLIGEYRPKEDTHESVIGKVPGFMLQANYIESLLDDRFFQQIPKWLEIVLTVLCLVLLDIMLERARNPYIGALAAACIVIALWFISHFAIMEWGYYFVFWFPMAIALPAKLLEAVKKVPPKVANA